MSGKHSEYCTFVQEDGIVLLLSKTLKTQLAGCFVG